MSKISYTKPFLSYQAQLALLKSRGMQFADEVEALRSLANVSYYRLSGYWYPLLSDKENHIFKPGITFESAYSLYRFDQELRRLILTELERIEISVRAKITHELSTRYGSFWLGDLSLFADTTQHVGTSTKIEEELSRSDEEFITSFQTKYINPLPPSYITLEIVSFGILSRLYGNLKSGTDKRAISAAFGLTDKVFVSWLHSFVRVRNICAHHGRLWNRQLHIRPLVPRKPFNTWLTDKDVSNNRMYFVLSMILYVLNTIDPSHDFKQNLSSLFQRYPNVDSRAMGFPVLWQTEPLWSQD
jgi:abortive infection bacteriophage resistance protein